MRKVVRNQERLASSRIVDDNDNRTHNEVKELLTADVWQNPAHDAADNMTTSPQPSDMTAGYTATYDAWNRMVSVNDGTSDVQVNEYDGQRL